MGPTQRAVLDELSRLRIGRMDSVRAMMFTLPTSYSPRRRVVPIPEDLAVPSRTPKGPVPADTISACNVAPCRCEHCRHAYALGRPVLYGRSGFIPCCYEVQ